MLNIEPQPNPSLAAVMKPPCFSSKRFESANPSPNPPLLRTRGESA